MRRMSCFTVATMALLLGSAAIAQQRGDWVLAQWQGGVYWFPGVVESRTRDTVTINYDDGTRETRPINQVKIYDWHVGSRVECRWAGGSDWYAGRITSMHPGGSKISIAYDDGDREQTTTAMCRSR
ncbi:MAG: hypothetical protein KDI71_06715 [Xanthomonadales bacterium]|nr:hypothetical protein [Xanthomonadales bacterium]